MGRSTPDVGTNLGFYNVYKTRNHMEINVTMSNQVFFASIFALSLNMAHLSHDVMCVNI